MGGLQNHKPIRSITKDQIIKRHRELGENSGKTTANIVMRIVSSMYGFAIEYYEDSSGQPLLVRNPVVALKHHRAWYPSHRRQTLIKATELSDWFRGVRLLEASPDPQARMVADYLQLLLFTGMRKRESAMIRCDDVDTQRRQIIARNTKSKQVLVLPLSPFLLNLVEKRLEVADSEGYLFPWPTKNGFIGSPYRYTDQVKMESGVSFSYHDLRRTFITTAESLNISMLTIKRLVNHSVTGDVTSGYVILDVERLRAPMQQISDYFEAHKAKASQSASLQLVR